MPAIARGRQTDTVFSKTGTGDKCRYPVSVTTGVAENSKVSVGGIGVITKGDLVGPHLESGCTPDTSTLDTFSSKVTVGGLGIARIGDTYSSDNTITTGSSKVFAG